MKLHLLDISPYDLRAFQPVAGRMRVYGTVDPNIWSNISAALGDTPIDPAILNPPAPVAAPTTTELTGLPAAAAAPITAAPTTSGIAAIPTAAPTPVAAPAPPVDPTAGLTFDPTSGKWGTYARAGWQTDYANIFTPAAVQPTGGYTTSKQIESGTPRNPSTSTVYTWNVGEDPAVTAAYARGTAAGQYWGLNYDQFAKAMAPYGGPNASFSDPNGAGPQLQLAANPFGKTGTTWQPSGASSGITFIPKGTRPMLTSGGREGTPTYGPATTEDQWKISGDMSQLMGAEGTNAHTDVTYHKVGDQLVPVDNPSNWTWQSSSLLQPLLIAAAVVAAAYTGGASLSALGGEAAAGAAGAGAAGAGAAGAGAAGAGLAAGEAAAATVATAASTAGMTVSSFLAAPAMSIGTALGLEGTAAQLVGSTIINTAMNGGDVGAAIKSAGLSYGLNLASGTLNNAVNTALADSGLPTAATDAISKGITGATISAVTGGDPLQGLIGAEIGVATKGITDNITGFKDLPPQVQNAVNTAIKGELQGKSGDQITQSVLNNALQAGYKTVEKAGAGAIDSLLNTPAAQAELTPEQITAHNIATADPTTNYEWYDNTPMLGEIPIGDHGGSASADAVKMLTDAGLVDTLPEPTPAPVPEVATPETAPAPEPQTVEELIASLEPAPEPVVLPPVDVVPPPPEPEPTPIEQPYVPWEENFPVSEPSAEPVVLPPVEVKPAPEPTPIEQPYVPWEENFPVSEPSAEPVVLPPVEVKPTPETAPYVPWEENFTGTTVLDPNVLPPVEVKPTPEPTPELPYVPWEENFTGTTVLDPNVLPPVEVRPTPEPTPELPDLPAPEDEQPWVQPNPDDLLPPVITPPVVTPPVVVPPKVTPKAATPTPAAPQQYTTTTSSVPTALADIHQMDFSGWNMNDLVKYLQESKTGAQNKPQTPIFAAEGGSIDDLIEYLRR